MSETDTDGRTITLRVRRLHHAGQRKDPVDYGAHPSRHPRPAIAPQAPITLEPLSKFPLVRERFFNG